MSESLKKIAARLTEMNCPLSSKQSLILGVSLAQVDAEISYRDATIRDQAERLRCAAGGVQCERMVNEVKS